MQLVEHFEEQSKNTEIIKSFSAIVDFPFSQARQKTSAFGGIESLCARKGACIPGPENPKKKEKKKDVSEKKGRMKRPKQEKGRVYRSIRLEIHIEIIHLNCRAQRFFSLPDHIL